MTPAKRIRHFWLVKSEPASFSFADLMASTRRTARWDGVRNYQARNFMRDGMRKGDGVLFYHSGSAQPAIAGFAEVWRAAYPDPTALDPADPHFDPKSSAESPTWMNVDIRGVAPVAPPLTLAALRDVKGLGKMALLQKGSRLSVQPVTAGEWAIIEKLAAKKPVRKPVRKAGAKAAKAR